MSERIDELRHLLDRPDRHVASVVMLQGVRETTPPEAMARTYAPSGDVAYVFVGPRDVLRGERRENKEDGSGTYSFTFPKGVA